MRKRVAIRQIYAAAELVATGKEDYSCLALAEVANYKKSLRRAYESLYRDDAVACGHRVYTWGETAKEAENTPMLRRRRVLLLCWFAEMVRTGEVKV